MNSLRTAKRYVFPLLGLWVLLYASFSLLKPPLLDGADSVQAEAAREMAANGDWLMPHVNGARSLAVSPLLTWVTAASFKLFGVSDWTARLPFALCALALFIAVLALGARLFLTPVAGFYAAVILLTSAGIFLFAHLLYPEIFATLWITLAMYFFWRSLHGDHASRRTVIGFAAVCALGVLTQGLSGIIIPGLIVVLFLAITRKLPHLLRWHPLIGILVFLVIAAPWHLAVRYTNAITSRFDIGPGPRSAPLLLVWAFLLLWMLPWCFFSVSALVRLPARVAPHSKHMDPSHQARLLLVLWIVIESLWIAFTPRQEFTILPALPAIALLAAGWMAADESAPSRVGLIFAWVFLAAGLVGGGIAVFVALRAPLPAPAADIATLLHLHPGQHHIFLGHLGDVTFASMGVFRIPLLIAAAALFAGVVTNLVFRLRNQARMANCFLAGMMVFLLIAADVALNTFSPVISSEVLAEAIKPELQTNDIVVVDGEYRHASALGFYLERHIEVMNPNSEEDEAALSGATVNLESLPSLQTQWDGSSRVFLWTTPQSAPNLPGSTYLIARDGGREILSNQPNSGGASF